MRVYKGQDLELTTVLSVCQPSYENLELAFYTTDPDMAAVFSGDDITIDENKATVTIPSNILDIMDDGVLRGKVKYGEVVFDIPTTMYLKTPQGYTPIHPEEGVILIGKTITENGEYAPEEGYAYNNVVVNVPTGGNCPELEEEVERLEGENAELANKNEELTNKVTELNSQIDEKNAEIVSKDAEIAVLVTEAEEAYDNGVADQKRKLEPITIIKNGVYTREDGYSGIEVNVPSYMGYTGKSVALKKATVEIPDVILSRDSNGVTYEFEMTSGFDLRDETQSLIYEYFPVMHFGDGYKVGGEWDGIRLSSIYGKINGISGASGVSVTCGGSNDAVLIKATTYPTKKMQRYSYKLMISSGYVEEEGKCSLTYRLFNNNLMILEGINTIVRCGQPLVIGGGTSFYFTSLKVWDGVDIKKDRLRKHIVFNGEKLEDIINNITYDINGEYSEAYI